jgi:methylated-DNA-[protein]-cysteine S-methyltransferase
LDIYIGVTEGTPLGVVWAAVSDLGLVAIQIGGEGSAFSQKLATKFRVSPIPSKSRAAPFLHQIEAYLRGQQKNFDILIHWEFMSPFQQKVLQVVCAIPFGETRTYGQIAAQIEKPRATRAVGRANATNPMPLVIPCHRLVGADGSLRGYGGGEGIKTKAWLLALEKGDQR